MNEVASRLRRINVVDTSLLTDLFMIALLWCISIVVVNPVGNFPVIDDELYEPAVRSFLQTGHYSPPEAAMTFLTNLLWGALFSLPAGVSFTALRMSTLCASLLGLFGVYTLTRDLGQPRWIRWLATLTVAANPAFYALSHTFMTDVLFAVICIWAAVFFARSLRSGSGLDLVFGTLLSLAATLSRQIGLAIPLAFAITLIFQRGITWKTILRAGIPLGLGLITLSGFYHWLAASGQLPQTYDYFANMEVSTFTHSRTFFTTPISNVYCTVVFLGLFLLPILLCTMGGPTRSGTKGVLAIAAAGATIVVLGAVVRAHLGLSDFMPLREGHVLRESGIGLLWLQGEDQVPQLPTAFWICVTALAFIGAALLVYRLSFWLRAVVHSLVQRSPLSEAETVTLFLLTCGFILAAPYIGIRSSDRYLISSLPFFVTGIVSFPGTLSAVPAGVGRSLRQVAFVLLAAFGVFTVVGTRDYLAWHRLSSQASRELMETNHVAADDIDGGVEFNFLHPGHPSRADLDKRTDKLIRNRPQYFFTERIREQFEVVVAQGWRPPSSAYQVAFGPVPEYRVIREYAYYNWMPPHVQKILALQREQ